MVQISNSDRNKLVSYLVGLKEQPNIKEHLIKVLLAEDENINLDVYDTHKLYHLANDMEHREISDILKSKLDLLFTNIPKFFKDAFESRGLYPYLKDQGPLSFFKDNVLLPVFHNDTGLAKYDDLEKIISDIRSSINNEIKRINKSKQFGVLYAKQEQRTLPFFELLKSMINPKLARTEDEKYDNYAYLTMLVRSKLEFDGKIQYGEIQYKKTQSRFRAVQLKENKELGNDDNNLGIDWNDKGHPNKSNKRFFSGEYPACLSDKVNYRSLNIKIEDENGENKTLDYFMQEYLGKIKAKHKISEIKQNDNILEFWNRVFLAEDRKNSNPNNTEHARLKLECRAPKYVKNVYNENFLRMAFDSTNEPGVYKMTKEGREEYHYNVIFHKQSFPDDSYIYAADDVIKVTDISEDTYQHAGVCAGIIKPSRPEKLFDYDNASSSR